MSQTTIKNLKAAMLGATFSAALAISPDLMAQGTPADDDTEGAALLGQESTSVGAGGGDVIGGGAPAAGLGIAGGVSATTVTAIATVGLVGAIIAVSGSSSSTTGTN